MDDLMIQFARLWGQREVLILNSDDEIIANILKSYDSEELLQLLKKWADEFVDNNESDDTVDFFERKIEGMLVVHIHEG